VQILYIFRLSVIACKGVKVQTPAAETVLFVAIIEWLTLEHGRLSRSVVSKVIQIVKSWKVYYTVTGFLYGYRLNNSHNRDNYRIYV
jgi:hypothetical protein